ncbi:hypothetical protein WR25_15644 [Diploscapter pachys]|uniref:Metalloendopeptidase n=1 Tax=Diploscapter pachys TaxID=2018661 RepID=A0A2A2KUW7_9BILA|nr:hypothetical protein WR25_15644 [Diploscapter pachys]
MTTVLKPEPEKDHPIQMQDCKNNDCKTQSSIYIETKNSLMKTAQVFEKKFFNNDAKVDIDRQFSAIWDYKKALIDKAGLSQYVSPADNGLVDGDVLLSEQQARFLINELQKGNFDGNWKNLPLPDLNRDKRSALFFGENNQFIQKWDTSQPILYMFDETYDEYEKNSVRQAHRMISSAASCIHFQFDPIAYKKGHFIYYTRTITPAVCGLSHVGRQPKGNVIQINFESCEKLAQTGVIIHETLHALGIEHTHQRVDRDDFIEIVWNRINPQLIDTFVHADNNIYSTYGVQYDFDSIMQYKWNMGSKIPNKETMKPKIAYTQNRARMGQRNHLSPSDIEILNKLYCWTGCRDLKVMCGRWAMLGLCSDAKYKTFMKNRCKLSCG